MSLNRNVTLRPATPADWPAIEALLLANKLPPDGAEAHLGSYLLAISNGEIVGTAGLEVYAHIALLRSVAVAPGLHKQGIGKRLIDGLIEEARQREIARLYLLTVTAPEYFAQFGFRRSKIDDAPQALKVSAEFQGACPACAAFMTLGLQLRAPLADDELPVAVLGAGPVGLAAAARLLERGIPFVVFEAASQVGANLLDYGHVRLFSPWQYNIDHAIAQRLVRHGWQTPPAEALPLAREIVERVLLPFAALPEVADALQLDTRVVSVSREGFDKVKSAGRADAPFVIRAIRHGKTTEWRARAVIDATGTWGTPNPVGANGLPALGEPELAEQISYRIPDIIGSERARFAGKRTLVVGAGHSAANALLYLAELAQHAPDTELIWAVRSPSLKRVFGGGAADALPARGELGSSLRALRDSGAMRFVGGLRIGAIERDGVGRLTVSGLDLAGKTVTLHGIDQIVSATGQRPDLSLTSELRVRLDPWLESTEALGPLIDPNEHSCGTVRPHGHRELAHPEPGLYTVGVKCYGRAPTFLMATGFEQVRSVVAAIAGDLEAADRVELDLPETGVCSVAPSDDAATARSCCASAVTPPTAGAAAKAATGGGCAAASCATPATTASPAATAARCCG